MNENITNLLCIKFIEYVFYDRIQLIKFHTNKVRSAFECFYGYFIITLQFMINIDLQYKSEADYSNAYHFNSLVTMRGIGVFLMLVGFAHSNVPKFEISGERSLDEGPSVVVTFPDGYTDTLFLSRHYSNDEDRWVSSTLFRFPFHLLDLLQNHYSSLVNMLNFC